MSEREQGRERREREREGAAKERVRVIERVLVRKKRTCDAHLEVQFLTCIKIHTLTD